MKAKVTSTWYVWYRELVGQTGEVVGEPVTSSLSSQYDGIMVEFEDGRQFMFCRDELEFLPEGVPAAPS